MSLLVICEILGAFVNTLTNEDKYPLQKCGNLWLTIQMQLPKKRKTCSDFFGPFWYLYQILIILKKKKMILITLFSEFKTIKDVVRQVSKKRRFRAPFNSQLIKGSQTRVKSAWQHFYDVGNASLSDAWNLRDVC